MIRLLLWTRKPSHFINDNSFHEIADFTNTRHLNLAAFCEPDSTYPDTICLCEYFLAWESQNNHLNVIKSHKWHWASATRCINLTKNFSHSNLRFNNFAETAESVFQLSFGDVPRQPSNKYTVLFFPSHYNSKFSSLDFSVDRIVICDLWFVTCDFALCGKP